MTNPLEVRTQVLPGHRIEIVAPELPEGSLATVSIRIEDSRSGKKRRLSEILAGYAGRTLFRDANGVDAYVQAERDAWDK